MDNNGAGDFYFAPLCLTGAQPGHCSWEWGGMCGFWIHSVSLGVTVLPFRVRVPLILKVFRF
jgi:hypothetical protein